MFGPGVRTIPRAVSAIAPAEASETPLLAASLADDWPSSRDGIVQRTHQFGMTMEFPTARDDYAATRQVIDDWLQVVDEPEAERRALLLNEQMASEAAHPRLTNHDGEGCTCTAGMPTRSFHTYSLLS
jgi:hypothetical protein